MQLVEELFKEYQIIQAPMAGVTTPEMVIASCEAGILGSIGAGYLSAEDTRAFIRKVKKQTKKSFIVNLFAHDYPPIVEHEIQIAKQALIDANIDVNVKRDALTLSHSVFSNQLDIIIEEGVKYCSFTFGVPTKTQLRRLKKHGVTVIVTATSPDEIHELVNLDIDIICLQGKEAGGHRGSFIKPFQLIPLNELLTQALKITDKPLIVSGGIATGAQIDEYLKAGASAVMIGTLFVVSDESAAPFAYKQAILKAENNTTVVTESFSGRQARGIENLFIHKMLMMPIAPFPYQNDLTKGIRARAIADNNTENMSLWAGTSLYLAQAGTIKDIVKRLNNERE